MNSRLSHKKIFVLVKSGAIYDCDLTDVLPCKTETLNPWVQGPPAQNRTIDKKKNLESLQGPVLCGRWDLNPHDVAITRSLV